MRPTEASSVLADLGAWLETWPDEWDVFGDEGEERYLAFQEALRVARSTIGLAPRRSVTDSIRARLSGHAADLREAFERENSIDQIDSADQLLLVVEELLNEWEEAEGA